MESGRSDGTDAVGREPPLIPIFGRGPLPPRARRRTRGGDTRDPTTFVRIRSSSDFSSSDGMARGRLTRSAGRKRKAERAEETLHAEVSEPAKKAARTSMPKGSTGKTEKKPPRVRVWWAPTDDSSRSGFSGMYWPADLLSENSDDSVQVQYDNGDKETVHAEYLQPCDPPLDFGKETRALEVGEFVEVFNNSKTDPAEWVGVIKLAKKKKFRIHYPFHSADDEDVESRLLRRARVWDSHLGKWLFVQPFQEWKDGEVTAPVELYLCTEKQLFALLAGDCKKITVVSKKAASRLAEKSRREAEERLRQAEGKDKSVSESMGGSTAQRRVVPENTVSTDPQAVAETRLGSRNRTSDAKAGSMERTNQPSPSPSERESPARTSNVSQGASGVPQAKFSGTRIPPEWLPAPNLGPNSYIVPSSNPSDPRALGWTRMVMPYMSFDLHSVLCETGAEVRRDTEYAPPYVIHMTPDSQHDTLKPKVSQASPTEIQNLQTAGAPPPATASGKPGVKRKIKDPNEPRKPPTAYILFITAHRDKVREEMGSEVPSQDVTKRLAEMWSVVTAEEKQLLQDQVDVERMRYEEAMRNYAGPSQLPQGEDDHKKKKKSKKDEDAPRRPRTAYILFSIDFRKEADKELDFTQATLMAADAWKNVDKPTKDRYLALAANEKDAYEAAVKVYNQYVEQKNAQEKERLRQAEKAHFQIPDMPTLPVNVAGPQTTAGEPRPAQPLAPVAGVGAPLSRPPALLRQPTSSEMGPDVVAGYPTDTLERLNLETARQALKKEKLHGDAYYMLIDAWRHDSPRLEAALRAYRMHIETPKKPDYKGFMIGIFEWETIRGLTLSTPTSGGP